MAQPGCGGRGFCERMMSFRRRVSGFCERFVANRGVGRAHPEMRFRNRVGGPATRGVRNRCRRWWRGHAGDRSRSRDRDVFVLHEAIWALIRGSLLLSGDCLPSSNFSVAREGRRGGVGAVVESGVWGVFCGRCENLKRLSPKLAVSAERKRDSALVVWNESIAGVAIHARVESGFGSH